MLKIIISPAKKMNVRNDILSYKNIPFFINEAQTLFSYMKNMSFGGQNKLREGSKIKLEGQGAK